MNWRNIGPLAKLELTPREQVEVLYELYPQPRTFEQDVAIHRLTGVVVEREDFFLMARGVKHDAGHEALSNPEVSFTREAQDCWLVHALAGSLVEMVTVAPYYLPIVCWSRRRGRWHFYRYDSFCWRVARLERSTGNNKICYAASASCHSSSSRATDDHQASPLNDHRIPALVVSPYASTGEAGADKGGAA